MPNSEQWKQLSDHEKKVYWTCYENPRTIYQIIAEAGIEKSYTSVLTICNILEAKRFLKRIKSMGGKTLFSSVELETQKTLEPTFKEIEVDKKAEDSAKKLEQEILEEESP